jgi:hypothetical protein
VVADSITDYIITDHARTEIERRRLGKETIDRVLKNPEQRLVIRPGRGLAVAVSGIRH